MRGRADLVRYQVDAVRELGGVDGVDEVEELQCVAHLVGLEVSDEVPLRTRHARRLLPRRLLHLVLADYRKPGVPRLLHDLRAVRLRHGDNLHLVGAPPRAFARRGDSAADVFKYLSKISHLATLRLAK